MAQSARVYNTTLLSWHRLLADLTEQVYMLCICVFAI